MTARADIVRFADANVAVAHCILGAWEVGEFLSVSNPGSVAVAFTRQRKATVQLHDTRWVDRTIPAESFGTAGPTPIAWIRIKEPAECLEVTASRPLRASIAEEFNVLRHCDLDDLHGSSDPIIWSATARLRSIVRGGTVGDALEIEALVRHLYTRVLTLCFGGKPAVRGDGGLGRQRLVQLFEWIEAHLDEQITIARLAAVAALSHAHFMRSFKRSVGVSPHQYVRARRLEHAREQLAVGASVAATAHRYGFLSLSQFRNAFCNYFGHLPHATRRRDVRVTR